MTLIMTLVFGHNYKHLCQEVQFWKNFNMYQCSRAGASLNLKVRNRSKMRTNHPVVSYIAFIWYRLNVPKVNNACFTDTIFFKKKYLLILRPLAEVRSLQLVFQFSKFSQHVRQERSCNDQSAPAKPR